MLRTNSATTLASWGSDDVVACHHNGNISRQLDRLIGVLRQIRRIEELL